MAPYVAIGPTRAPPTLWAQFQKDIQVPLSFIENQCVMTLPHGGHPIPLNQPTRKLSTAISIIAQALCSIPIHFTGTIMKAIDRAAITRPRGRNFRASERSEMLAIRNFEKP